MDLENYNLILEEHEAEIFADEYGNLVAPPGYTFVEVDTATSMKNPLSTPVAYSIGNQTPANTPKMMSTPNFNAYYGPNEANSIMHFQPRVARSDQNMRHFAPPFRPKQPTVNIKEKLVEFTYKAVKTAAIKQGIWVEKRTEDEGFFSIRVHAKKKYDIALLPIIVQKIQCEVGLLEFSMHLLRRKDKLTGLTVYLRTHKKNEDTVAALAEFADYDVTARRVREPKLADLKAAESPAEAPRRKLTSKNVSFSISKTALLSTSKSAPVDLNKCTHQSLNLQSLKLLQALKPSRSSFNTYSAEAKIVRPAESPVRKFEDEDPDFLDILEEKDGSNSFQIAKPKPKSRTRSALVKTKSRSKSGVSLLVSAKSLSSSPSVCLKLSNGKTKVVNASGAFLEK